VDASGVAFTRLYSPELENMWAHLGRSGLISNQYVGYTGTVGVYPVPGKQSPAVKMPGSAPDISYITSYFNTSGGVWLMPLDGAFDAVDLVTGGHGWLLTSNTQQNATSGIYTAPQIYALEMKLDDGFPLLGNIRAFNSTLYTPADFLEALVPGQTCLNPTVDPWVYRYKNSTPNPVSVCSAVIAASF
jgi:hypothetical protein